jgi:hypothetical protein
MPTEEVETVSQRKRTLLLKPRNCYYCAVSQEPPDIENLLRLNPKVNPYANAVPSAVTKKVRTYDLYVTFVRHTHTPTPTIDTNL